MTTLKGIIDSVFTSGQEFQAKQELGQQWADGKKNEALQAIKEILEGLVKDLDVSGGGSGRRLLVQLKERIAQIIK
jgi:hypothetical protein